MATLSESNITGHIICHNVPELGGVYIVTDPQLNVLYVGSSGCLRRRISYLEGHVFDSSRRGYTHDASEPLIQFQRSGGEAHVHFIVCADYKEREKELIRKYDPPWNKR